MVGNLLANIVLPAPGGPIKITLCLRKAEFDRQRGEEKRFLTKRERELKTIAQLDRCKRFFSLVTEVESRCKIMPLKDKINQGILQKK